jgi:hypothetical protein
MGFAIEHLLPLKVLVISFSTTALLRDPCIIFMSIPTATLFFSTDEPDGFSLARRSLTMIPQVEISRSVRYRGLR